MTVRPTKGCPDRDELEPDELTLMVGLPPADASAAWVSLAGSRADGTLPEDLAAALATSMVLHLQRAGLAKPQAAALIASHWPEWARAILAGAKAADLVPSRRRTSDPTSSLLMVYPRGGLVAEHADGIAENPGHVLPHGSHSRRYGLGGGAGLAVQCASLASMLAAQRPNGRRAALVTDALVRLDLAFGDDERGRERPLRSMDEGPGPDFLHRGPYLERAEEVLCASHERFDPDRNPGPAAWLAHLLDYAVKPPPVDHWKAHAGIGDGHAELWQLLVASVQVRGVGTSYRLPETFLSSLGGLPEIRSRATSLIAAIRQHEQATAA